MTCILVNRDGEAGTPVWGWRSGHLLASQSGVSNSVLLHMNSSSAAHLPRAPWHTPRLSRGQNQLCEWMEVRLRNGRGSKPDDAQLGVPLVTSGDANVPVMRFVVLISRVSCCRLCVSVHLLQRVSHSSSTMDVSFLRNMLRRGSYFSLGCILMGGGRPGGGDARLLAALGWN